VNFFHSSETIHLSLSLDWDASNSVLGIIGKLSRRTGALAWFHGVWTWTCSVEVLEY